MYIVKVFMEMTVRRFQCHLKLNLFFNKIENLGHAARATFKPLISILRGYMEIYLLVSPKTTVHSFSFHVVKHSLFCFEMKIGVMAPVHH